MLRNAGYRGLAREAFGDLLQGLLLRAWSEALAEALSRGRKDRDESLLRPFFGRLRAPHSPIPPSVTARARTPTV